MTATTNADFELQILEDRHKRAMILLRRLTAVSEPYLIRQKMTRRSYCKRLNEVHKECTDYLGKWVL